MDKINKNKLLEISYLLTIIIAASYIFKYVIFSFEYLGSIFNRYIMFELYIVIDIILIFIFGILMNYLGKLNVPKKEMFAFIVLIEGIIIDILIFGYIILDIKFGHFQVLLVCLLIGVSSFIMTIVLAGMAMQSNKVRRSLY